MVQKKVTNFLVSPYYTLLFSSIKFSEVALIAVHGNNLIAALLLREDLGLEIIPEEKRIFTCLWKTASKTLKENAKFVQTYYQVH